LIGKPKTEVEGGRKAAGLMIITAPPPTILASKEIIPAAPLGPGQTVTIKPPTNYRLAIMLFHGDGNGDVEVRIQGATTRTINGNEQGIELIAVETVSLTAYNSNSTLTRFHPTIEILAMS
jgi:hypothetical protein